MSDEKVAFFGPQYGTGGAGRVCSAVGKTLAREGYGVDFLVDGTYSEDSYLEEGLPHTGRVVRLTETRCSDPGHDPRRYVELLSALATYLRREDGGVLVSNLTKFNLMSVWASVLSGFGLGLVLVEHNLISPRITGRSRILPWLVRTHYSFADEIVAVSADVGTELRESHGVGASTCTTIRNPLDVEQVAAESHREVDHDWFLDDIPVVMGIGRFVEQKQFSILLEAFELLTRHADVRLLLAGTGPLKEDLHDLTIELEIEDRVDFLGFVPNPYKYMRRAGLLAVSSRYEGFGLILTEALACGTPVVSTDCPGGPSDILNDGEYGELVDVGDPRGLAEAMARTLDDPPDPDRLVERAQHYRVEKVADRYAEVIDRATK
jgi:glycosyltransferase involved in cell wall biosynthesis